MSVSEDASRFPADFLDGLSASNLPTILVSCKCDNPENTRQVSVENMEDACTTCVEAVKTASNVPESARLCLSSMLKAIMASRNGQSQPGSVNMLVSLDFLLLFFSHITPAEKCSMSWGPIIHLKPVRLYFLLYN